MKTKLDIVNKDVTLQNGEYFLFPQKKKVVFIQTRSRLKCKLRLNFGYIHVGVTYLTYQLLNNNIIMCLKQVIGSLIKYFHILHWNLVLENFKK